MTTNGLARRGRTSPVIILRRLRRWSPCVRAEARFNCDPQGWQRPAIIKGGTDFWFLKINATTLGRPFLRPITLIMEMGGLKVGPTSGYVIAFNFLFQRP